MTRTVKAVVMAVVVMCAALAYAKGYKPSVVLTEDVFCEFSDEDEGSVRVEKVTAVLFDGNVMRVKDRNGNIYLLCVSGYDEYYGYGKIIFRGNLTNDKGEWFERYQAYTYIMIPEEFVDSFLYPSRGDDYYDWIDNLTEEEFTKAYRGM